VEAQVGQERSEPPLKINNSIGTSDSIPPSETVPGAGGIGPVRSHADGDRNPETTQRPVLYGSHRTRRSMGYKSVQKPKKIQAPFVSSETCRRISRSATARQASISLFVPSPQVSPNPCHQRLADLLISGQRPGATPTASTHRTAQWRFALFHVARSCVVTMISARQPLEAFRDVVLDS